MNLIILTLLAVISTSCDEKEQYPDDTMTETLYTMPEESEMHEGTWLQWPHQYQYGTAYRNSLDATWVEMTKALVTSEKVHIVAYNEAEKNRITHLLSNSGIPINNVDFKLYKTDDVWVRDNDLFM